MIKRLYLAEDGTERFPQDGQRHYSIGEVVLRQTGLPVGNADEVYRAIWTLVDDNKIKAEAYIDGRPVVESELTPEQRLYFQRLQLEGKIVVLNARTFKNPQVKKEG